MKKETPPATHKEKNKWNQLRPRWQQFKLQQTLHLITCWFYFMNVLNNTPPSSQYHTLKDQNRIKRGWSPTPSKKPCPFPGKLINMAPHH